MLRKLLLVAIAFAASSVHAQSQYLATTSFTKTLLRTIDDAAELLTTIGGQPLDGELNALSLTTSAANKLPYYTGSGTAATTDFTAFGRTLAGCADADAALAALGISEITPSSTVGQVLRVTGADTYAWGAIDLADTDAITGDLPYANLAQGSALSVLGVTGNATADNASIAAGSDHQVLRRSGTSVAFGAIPLDQGAATSGTLLSARIPDASTSQTGEVELATSAETTTASDTGRALTPDGLRGSDYGKVRIQLACVGMATALTTGDFKGEVFYRVPVELNGWNLVDAHVGLGDNSSSGTPTFHVRRIRLTNATTEAATVSLTSTAITVDQDEFDSKDAATQPVIDTSVDDVATGDKVGIQCTTAGTGTKGLAATLIFQKP